MTGTETNELQGAADRRCGRSAQGTPREAGGQDPQRSFQCAEHLLAPVPQNSLVRVLVLVNFLSVFVSSSSIVFLFNIIILSLIDIMRRGAGNIGVHALTEVS